MDFFFSTQILYHFVVKACSEILRNLDLNIVTQIQ